MLCVPKDLFWFFPLWVPALEIQSQFWEQTTSLSSHISSPVIKTWRSKHALGGTSTASLFASDQLSIGISISISILGAWERAGPRLLLALCLPRWQKKTKCKTISKWQGWRCDYVWHYLAVTGCNMVSVLFTCWEGAHFVFRDKFCISVHLDWQMPKMLFPTIVF